MTRDELVEVATQLQRWVPSAGRHSYEVEQDLMDAVRSLTKAIGRMSLLEAMGRD